MTATTARLPFPSLAAVATGVRPSRSILPVSLSLSPSLLPSPFNFHPSFPLPLLPRPLLPALPPLYPFRVGFSFVFSRLFPLFPLPPKPPCRLSFLPGLFPPCISPTHPPPPKIHCGSSSQTIATFCRQGSEVGPSFYLYLLIDFFPSSLSPCCLFLFSSTPPPSQYDYCKNTYFFFKHPLSFFSFIPPVPSLDVFVHLLSIDAIFLDVVRSHSHAIWFFFFFFLRSRLLGLVNAFPSSFLTCFSKPFLLFSSIVFSCLSCLSLLSMSLIVQETSTR